MNTSAPPCLLIYCALVQVRVCVVLCLVKGNRSHGTVIQQIGNHPKYYIPFDWNFICSIDLKYSGVLSNGHFSTHAISDSRLRSVSHSLNLLLSFSLYLSSAYSPLHFYPSPFHIKRNWFVWSAFLNKHIWTNAVPILGFAHNTCLTDYVPSWEGF